uniref:Uncharacterized protein n=1 Tax=Zea mays TaxID=4577 RepID=B6T0I3_MAIZE|nr:hypothetical protein [Zea mays]
MPSTVKSAIIFVAPKKTLRPVFPEPIHIHTKTSRDE